MDVQQQQIQPSHKTQQAPTANATNASTLNCTTLTANLTGTGGGT